MKADEYVAIFKKLVANGVPDAHNVALSLMDIERTDKAPAIGFEIATDEDIDEEPTA